MGLIGDETKEQAKEAAPFPLLVGHSPLVTQQDRMPLLHESNLKTACIVQEPEILFMTILFPTQGDIVVQS
jgi:hypothetical protein